MVGVPFDCVDQPQHLGHFVGRGKLLAHIDQLLTTGPVARSIAVISGPGMGKSALLAAWLASRKERPVPHHFIRRGEYDWDDPAIIVSSLVAQIGELFPTQREAEGDRRNHPAARLASILKRVSRDMLQPRAERLVILIDGLDEYDPPPGARVGEPLAAFLPHTLPEGVSLLCASRPRDSVLRMLETCTSALVRIELDHLADTDLQGDNEETVRVFWEAKRAELGLDVAFTNEAARRALGNMQHAITLWRQLLRQPGSSPNVEDIPSGLWALIERTWQRLAQEPLVVRALGILCASREPLTLDELGVVAGWSEERQRRLFRQVALEVLLESKRSEGILEYRLHHESIRAYIAAALGQIEVRSCHAALARQLATWPPPLGAAARRYALRHALLHRVEAEEWDDAWRLATDLSFLQAKCCEVGVHEVEVDLLRAAEQYRRLGAPSPHRHFDEMARAFTRESHWLLAEPAATSALLWNRLRRSKGGADGIAEQLTPAPDTSFLRVRFAVTRESPSMVRELIGHAGAVLGCALSDDGRRLISASEDGTLGVWDLESGRLLVPLEGHTAQVLACVVTADGRVVSGSADHTLKIWDLESGRLLFTLDEASGHTAAVSTCAVAGRRMVSGGWDGAVKLWDLEHPQAPSLTLRGHTGWVSSCAITADGRRAVSSAYDRSLKVWDLQRGALLDTFKGHTEEVSSCAITADGRWMVSGSYDRTLLIWDVERGRVRTTLKGHEGRILGCAITSDGRVLSTADDATMRLWDSESGRELACFEGHSGRITACTSTRDGQYAISASGDGDLKVWSLKRTRLSEPLQGHRRGVRACTVLADGRAVSASEDGTLKVWDLESGGVEKTLIGHSGWVHACAATPDGSVVFSGADDQTLKAWNLEQGSEYASWKIHHRWVRSCTVTTAGRRALTAADHTLRLWDLESRVEISCLTGHTSTVRACAVTPDGLQAVSGAEDGELKLWDLENGCEIRSLGSHKQGARTCVVTPDGQQVVSGGLDGLVRRWDLKTGHELQPLEAHTHRIRACAVMPDGRHVISASDDRTLRVWDLKSGACLFTHRGDAPYMAVAASDTAVVAGDVVGTLWVLDWPPDRCDEIRATRVNPGRPSSMGEMVEACTILFLAAHASGDSEASAIQRELERVAHRERFKFVTRWSAEALDVLRGVREQVPAVLHVSTHHAGMTGLSFARTDGRRQYVSSSALLQTLEAVGESLQVVILSARGSLEHAQRLQSRVACAVGMGEELDFSTAQNFAIGFYGGLGAGETIESAFHHGCAAAGLMGAPAEKQPKAFYRDDNARRIVLVGRNRASERLPRS